MKEELCEKVVEVRMVSDRVMTAVVVFEEDVLMLICGCALHSGRSLEEVGSSAHHEKTSSLFMMS